MEDIELRTVCRKKRWLTGKRIIKIIFISVILLAVYVLIIEPRWIAVTHYDVYLSGLPPDLDGTKIVQLSDLHRGNKVPDSIIKRAVRLANAENPDVVVLTGDFINTSAANAEPCARMLSLLNARRGKFAVLGNHDHWYGARKVTDDLEAHGIQVLTNRNHLVAPWLYIIGIDDYWAGHPNIKRAWSGVDENVGQVLLSHTPRAAPLFVNKRCLALTGHTHGGQFIIPFIRRNRLPGLRGSPYISGWYQNGKSSMYVNRGIGMAMVPIRFLCRPEITVFTLKSNAGAANTP